MHQFVQVKMNYRNRNFGTLFVFVDIEEGGGRSTKSKARNPKGRGREVRAEAQGSGEKSQRLIGYRGIERTSGLFI
jgi:hypothetical protein